MHRSDRRRECEHVIVRAEPCKPSSYLPDILYIQLEAMHTGTSRGMAICMYSRNSAEVGAYDATTKRDC